MSIRISQATRGIGPLEAIERTVGDLDATPFFIVTRTYRSSNLNTHFSICQQRSLRLYCLPVSHLAKGTVMAAAAAEEATIPRPRPHLRLIINSDVLPFACEYNLP